MSSSAGLAFFAFQCILLGTYIMYQRIWIPHHARVSLMLFCFTIPNTTDFHQQRLQEMYWNLYQAIENIHLLN